MSADGNPTRRRWMGALAAAALGLSGAAACGLPDDTAPRPIDDVPPELTAPITTETTVRGAGRDSIDLFFYDDVNNRLVTLSRPVETLPDFQDALDAIAAQPSGEEIEQAGVSFSSKLPESLDPLAGQLGADGNLPIQVASGSQLRVQADAADQVRRVYTQVVCTMQAMDDDVLSVQLLDDQGMIGVPGNDGVLIDSRSVTPDDVGGCEAPDVDELATTTTSN